MLYTQSASCWSEHQKILLLCGLDPQLGYGIQGCVYEDGSTASRSHSLWSNKPMAPVVALMGHWKGYGGAQMEEVGYWGSDRRPFTLP